MRAGRGERRHEQEGGKFTGSSCEKAIICEPSLKGTAGEEGMQGQVERGQSKGGASHTRDCGGACGSGTPARTLAYELLLHHTQGQLRWQAIARSRLLTAAQSGNRAKHSFAATTVTPRFQITDLLNTMYTHQDFLFKRTPNGGLL